MEVSKENVLFGNFYSKVQSYVNAYFADKEQFRSVCEYLEKVPAFFRKDVMLSLDLADLEAKLVEKYSKFKSYL